jgi:hypothetical protein
MKILFVGYTWKGSSARSLREGLSAIPHIDLDEIGEDHYSPNGRSLIVRSANRLLRPWYQAELRNEIERKIALFKPDVLMVYKGSFIPKETVRMAKALGVFTVNVFPDCSPHAHGRQLHEAMGEYDLVISTKPFHPGLWNLLYGYHNRCVCVPHGYDPEVHYWKEPPLQQDLDLVMAASWRPQYEQLITDLSRELDTAGMSVVLAGNGWEGCRRKLPPHWQLPGGLYGRAYGELMRRGKIVIAPVHREVVIAGKEQPGDVDSTRSYELASAGCFFLHRRTDYIQTVYDEREEVPMWDNVSDLSQLIRHYLPREDVRRAMAARAHLRAVPAYSIPSRAQDVAGYLKV